MERKAGKVSVMTLDGGARFILGVEENSTGENPIAVNVDHPVGPNNQMTAQRQQDGVVCIAGQYEQVVIAATLQSGNIFVSNDGGLVKVVHESTDQRIRS